VVTPRATIFGYQWMDTLVHEYVHYVVSRVSHDHTPVWLHEGLARFEQVRWRKEKDALGPPESQLLAKALKKDALISFDAMHPSMAKLPSQEAAALAFAEVFTMIGFLHEQVGFEGLRNILALLKEGKDARQAVAEVTLKPFADVETLWKAHLKTLPLDTSGADDSPTIRFRKGKSDDENVGLDSIANKEAKKFTRLGGMLRARGLTAAAAVEYEKALKATPTPERFILSKLARTYLELQKYERAAELVGPLVAKDERDAAIATTLGRALLALNDPSGARDALEQALRISPFDPMVRCGLRDAYQALGDARAAREQKACQTLQR
jgi:tetratricopeptide (TPR) repeat protein